MQLKTARVDQGSDDSDFLVMSTVVDSRCVLTVILARSAEGALVCSFVFHFPTFGPMALQRDDKFCLDGFVMSMEIMSVS